MDTKQVGHTPGPWRLETVRTSCGVCHKVGPFPARCDDEKPRYACLYADYPSDWNPADQELFANARLIAAAPELLEALRPFAGGNWTKELADQARAAIAKATGNVHRDNPANESVRDAVDAATRVSSWSAQ